MEICKNCYWCRYDEETVGSDEDTNLCKFSEDGYHDEICIDDEMVPFFIALRERGYDSDGLCSGDIISTEMAMVMNGYVDTNTKTGKWVPQPSQDLYIHISGAGNHNVAEFFNEHHLLDLLPDEFMVLPNEYDSEKGLISIRKKYVNYVCDDQAAAYKDLCEARIKLLEWIEKLPYVNSEENE